MFMTLWWNRQNCSSQSAMLQSATLVFAAIAAWVAQYINDVSQSDETFTSVQCIIDNKRHTVQVQYSQPLKKDGTKRTATERVHSETSPARISRPHWQLATVQLASFSHRTPTNHWNVEPAASQRWRAEASDVQINWRQTRSPTDRRLTRWVAGRRGNDALNCSIRRSTSRRDHSPHRHQMWAGASQTVIA